MIRKDFLIREDQDQFLSMLPGTVSEHIRQAIDDYREKIKPRASTSPSTTESTSPSKKGGDNHG